MDSMGLIASRFAVHGGGGLQLKVEYKKGGVRVDVFGAFFESYSTLPDRVLIDGRAIIPEPDSDIVLFIDAVQLKITKTKNIPALIEITTSLKTKTKE